MSTQSLQQCLEDVAAWGAAYTLVDHHGEEYTATELAATLTRDHPEDLGLPVYLRLPDAQRDGAIYQATQSGFLRRYSIRPVPAGS